jgi:UPF0755 protein
LRGVAVKKAGLIFIIIIILISGMIRIASLLQPVSRGKVVSAKSVWINSGNSSGIIANKLAKKNIIKSSKLFNLLVGLIGTDDQLKAGYYEIKPNRSTWEIISILAKGRIDTFKFTIPEGYTVREIAEQLSKKTFYDKEDYLSVARTDFDREYLPTKANVNYTLEGFLYPNTYVIPRESTPKQVYDIFLDQFEERWLDRLEKDHGEKMGKYSIREIITIASLIEAEAKLDNEKRIISAVIYNRLKKRMFLQIDAGVQYSLPARKERILYKDLKVKSLYNTYTNPGLPVGPIGNPGGKAIKAALNPIDVDYLFYFALSDGSHKFTNSYKEHLKSQQKIETENKEE